jgi:hypothetical protein
VTGSNGPSDGGSSQPDGGSGPASACQDLLPSFGAGVEQIFDTGSHRGCAFSTSSASGQVALAVISSFDTSIALFTSDGSTQQGAVNGGVLVGALADFDSVFHPSSLGWHMVHHDPAIGGPEILTAYDASGAVLTNLEHAVDSSAPTADGGSVLLAIQELMPSPSDGHVIEWVDAAGHVLRSAPVDNASAALISTSWATGHVLVLAQSSPGQARWYDDQGAPLTPWFNLPVDLDYNVRLGAGFTHLLVDGSIALSYQGAWVALLRDGVDHADPAPDWLASRPHTRLATIRQGRGYALLPDLPAPNGFTSDDDGASFEIVATSGESCGTVTTPSAPSEPDVQGRAPRRLDVGQDGTMHQLDAIGRPEGSPNAFGVHCAFRWWPGLLR